MSDDIRADMAVLARAILLLADSGAGRWSLTDIDRIANYRPPLDAAEIAAAQTKRIVDALGPIKGKFTLGFDAT